MLSMVAFGCKQSVDSGDPNWTTDEKDHKVWERDNSSDQYVRAFKQFGTATNITSTVTRLEVGNLAASKAGLIFGLSEYSEEAGTYRYFVVGVGGHNYQTSQGEYYIAYYYDVDPASISQSSDRETATGTMIEIEKNTSFSSGEMKISGSVGYVFVGVKESGGTVTVTLGNQYDEKTKQIIGTKKEVTFKIGESADKEQLKKVTSIKGGIGAYGMLRKVNSGETSVSTKNDYLVKTFGPALTLAAEEAE